MSQDITGRKDIERLIDSFYDKVKINPVIGYIFNDNVNIQWETHLPVMYSFWATLLLDEVSYKGNAMLKHIELSRKTPLSAVHFQEWLRLFNETVDELFTGTVAGLAKNRAANIARLMLFKINPHEQITF
jgi:hemoglobin